MAENDETTHGLFGQIALSRGFITREQLLEALDEQTRLRTAGEPLELGQVLIRRNLLSTDQFVEILRLQNLSMLKCGRCGRTFKVLGLAKERSVKCVGCGDALEVPSDVRDLQAALGEPIAVTAESRGPVEAVRFKIGRYQLDREVARGGMGVVFEARDPALSRRVALKVIKESPRQGDLVKRLYREAEIAANLRHPNIVSIFEVGTDRGTHYIAMEYVEGRTLQQVIAAGPVPPREAARIMADVAAAVHHAHSRGVIHRDLKPANIIIDTSGRVVVTDFGLARAQASTAKLTQIGLHLGTPHYMSPEQARGATQEVDAQSDVFALGVVLYELLSGRKPFDAVSTLQVYSKIIGEAAPPLSGADPRPAEICARAMEKTKEARTPSAGVVEEGLRAWLSRTEAPQSLRLGRLLAIAGLAAVFALAASVAIAFRATPRDAFGMAVKRAQVLQADGDDAGALSAWFHALSIDPAHKPTRDAIADLAWARLVAAERAGGDTAAWRVLVETFHSGRYEEQLRARPVSKKR